MKLITSYNLANSILNSMKFPPPFSPDKNSPRLVIFINHYFRPGDKTTITNADHLNLGVIGVRDENILPDIRTV